MKPITPSNYVVIRKDKKYTYVITKVSSNTIDKFKLILSNMAAEAASDTKNMNTINMTTNIEHLNIDLHIDNVILYGNADETDNSKILNRISDVFNFPDGLWISSKVNLDDCTLSYKRCTTYDVLSILKYYRCLIGNPNNILIFKVLNTELHTLKK